MQITTIPTSASVLLQLEESFSPKMPLVVSDWQSVSYQGELLSIIILIGGTFELHALMIVLLSPSEHI